MASMKKKEVFVNVEPANVHNFPELPTIFPKERAAIKDQIKFRRRHRRRSIIREFSLNTSTHGLPGIVRSESIYNRLFWSISFLSFTGIMIFCVIKAIVVYFDYPTQIDINVVTEWPQYFPAVSICNAASFRLDRFIGPFLNYINALGLNSSYNTSTIPLDLVPFLGQFIIAKLNANEPYESYFYSLSSILYTCTFNSVPCSIDNFISFTSSAYGLCYTFNVKMKNDSTNKVRYGNEHGGNGVLDLELYVHSHQHVPYFWKGYGMVVLVHDNTQLPLIEAAGIQLIPGQAHKLGYKKKTIFFLSSPYTSCTNKVPLPMRIMYDNNYNGADYAYAETVCFQLCEQTYAYEQCGCVSASLWNARSIILPGTDKVILAPVCTDISFNSCYVHAVDTLLESLALREKYCSDCSYECSITDFIIQKSALATPMEWQLDGIKTFVEKSGVPIPSDWSTEWRSHIQRNYLSVSVVRETLIIENSTQKAQLSVYDVLSNIGGQSGLWIGLSFLSIMELAEMLYRLIRHQYHLVRVSLRKNKEIIPS